MRLWQPFEREPSLFIRRLWRDKKMRASGNDMFA